MKANFRRIRRRANPVDFGEAFYPQCYYLAGGVGRPNQSSKEENVRKVQINLRRRPVRDALVKRRIAMFCIRLGGVLGFSFMFLNCYFMISMPSHADPSSGRIYRVGRRLSPTYLTHHELQWLYILGCGALPFLVVG